METAYQMCTQREGWRGRSRWCFEGEIAASMVDPCLMDNNEIKQAFLNVMTSHQDDWRLRAEKSVIGKWQYGTICPQSGMTINLWQQQKSFKTFMLLCIRNYHIWKGERFSISTREMWQENEFNEFFTGLDNFKPGE